MVFTRSFIFSLPLLITAMSVSAGETAGAPWNPPPGLQQVPIWPGEVPDLAETTKAREESFLVSPKSGNDYTGVANVGVPTLTIYPPRGRATDAAVVVFPGGGFQILAIDIEGTEICDWFAGRGITCALLKYRVPGGNHHWDKDCRCHVTPEVPVALQDAQRSIRLVRAQASKLGVDPSRIGVIGFSAGGYLVAQTSNILESAYTPVDAADRLSSRPDFAVAIYPGHLCRAGGALDPDIKVGRHTPPTFLLQAWDDPTDERCNSTLYARALDEADVPAEVHLFAKGGHAFGMRDGASHVASWPLLLDNWLRAIGMVRTSSDG